MDIKQNISLSVVKGDHTFTFHMPVGTTWGNAVDAAHEILAHVGQMATQSIAQTKPQQAEQVVEPTIVEGI